MLSTWCCEHSDDISCSVLVNPSHTDESWEGRKACLWIYTCRVSTYTSNKKHFCGCDDTRQALTYFHCGPFKIKIQVLNLMRAKTVVLKTWEYNTSYISVRIIVP